jgi:SAM-dependent methyltransferase
MNSDFDIAAQEYDHHFSFSEIGKAQRERVYHFLEKELLSGKESLRILELNCGTGEDAHYLTQKGHVLLSTDISAGMIAQARQKYGKHIHFDIQDINTITATTFSKSFDLIFSNFGGLNCLSPGQIHSFLKIAPQLLESSGHLSLVFMPKACLWERIYFLAKANPKKAFRRNTKQAILANVDGLNVATWYYNPGQIKKWGAPYFKTALAAPIGIAIPPSYLEPFFKNKKGILKFLKKVETYLTSSFWAPYADHFMILLQKK